MNLNSENTPRRRYEQENDYGQMNNEGSTTPRYENEQAPGFLSRIWTRLFTGRKPRFATPDRFEEMKMASVDDEFNISNVQSPRSPQEEIMLHVLEQNKRRNEIDAEQIQMARIRNEIEQQRLDLLQDEKKKKLVKVDDLPIGPLGVEDNPYNINSATTFVKQVKSQAVLLNYNLQYLVKLLGGVVLTRLHATLNDDNITAGSNKEAFNEFLDELITNAPTAPTIDDEEKALLSLDVSMLTGQTLEELEKKFELKAPKLHRDAARSTDNTYARKLLIDCYLKAVPYHVKNVITTNLAAKEDDAYTFLQVVKMSKRVETHLRNDDRWDGMMQDMMKRKSRRSQGAQAYMAEGVPTELEKQMQQKHIPKKFWASIIAKPALLTDWVPYDDRTKCPKCNKYMPFPNNHTCPNGQSAANVSITSPTSEQLKAFADAYVAAARSGTLMDGPQCNMAQSNNDSELMDIYRNAISRIND